MPNVVDQFRVLVHFCDHSSPFQSARWVYELLQGMVGAAFQSDSVSEVTRSCRFNHSTVVHFFIFRTIQADLPPILPPALPRCLISASETKTVGNGGTLK
jgi:hypothetical protein